MTNLPITTTLEAIRKCSPCKDGWQKLLEHLGKTRADNEPLRFSTILDSNGIDDALWCLRSLGDEHRAVIRLLACDYAESALSIYESHYHDDKRPREAVETARAFAKGGATVGELKVAASAAEAAEAAEAAWAAEAAGAAWAAEAAEAAGAAGAAEAAEAAAWAAEAAAGAAAWAAWAAEAAAWAAKAAAWAEERQKQAILLVKYFG
jgi:hypothetical protein